MFIRTKNGLQKIDTSMIRSMEIIHTAETQDADTSSIYVLKIETTQCEYHENGMLLRTNPLKTVNTNYFVQCNSLQNAQYIIDEVMRIIYDENTILNVLTAFIDISDRDTKFISATSFNELMFPRNDSEEEIDDNIRYNQNDKKCFDCDKYNLESQSCWCDEEYDCRTCPKG